MSSPATAKITLPAVKPMLARLARQPFDSPDYLFELKWDGIRALAFAEGGQLRLQSRTGRVISSQFPELTEAIPKLLKVDGTILDGELVCLDQHGRPSFPRIQQRLNQKSTHVARRYPVHFIAFDLLYSEGISLMREPLSVRKNILHEILEPDELVQACEFIESDGKAFFQATCDLGLEGIMAKEKSGLYLPGKRSPGWLKVKRVRECDFVVAGYTFGGKRKELFSSLLLGLYNENEQLEYVGSVGTGFSVSEAKEMYQDLTQLHANDCPFKTTPNIQKFIYWCRPEMVCQVEYGEFTMDGKLRYPIYLRRRDDSSPTDCTLHEAPGWPSSFTR